MIIPFINFPGQCNEALAFYETIFAIENLNIMYFSDLPPNPNNPLPEGAADYVLHAEVTICGTKVWMGDTTDGATQGDLVSLAVLLPTASVVEEAFGKLLEGGAIIIPLEPTFYSPMFGTVKDKFGVIWHLICQSGQTDA